MQDTKELKALITQQWRIIFPVQLELVKHMLLSKEKSLHKSGAGLFGPVCKMVLSRYLLNLEDALTMVDYLFNEGEIFKRCVQIIA